ncbi:MAG: polymerase delta subunit [Clostridiales bacterium]|nr:polymerase delta subunit [Clostridiales bacterium]
MKNIKEHIKNNSFKNVYLLYGTESYLIKLYKNRFRETIVDKDDTMNYSYYEGKTIDYNEVLEISETLPFFSDRRLIIIENGNLFKSEKKEIGEKFINFFKTMPESTHIVFLEEAIDKRGKLYKAVTDKGYVAELKGLDEKNLITWLYQIVKKDEKNITEQTLLHFIKTVGTDMENLETEIEKLLCYTLDKTVIDIEDVDRISTSQVTNKVFDMINAIADKNQHKALALYNDLRILKEAPMRILFLIVRQFNILLQVKQLKGKGMNSQAISTQINLHRFIVEGCMKQSEKFIESKLTKALHSCIETETGVKQGRISDQLAIELLIVSLSS